MHITLIAMRIPLENANRGRGPGERFSAVYPAPQVAPSSLAGNGQAVARRF